MTTNVCLEMGILCKGIGNGGVSMEGGIDGWSIGR